MNIGLGKWGAEMKEKRLFCLKKKHKRLTYCQSLNLLQPEGFPKTIHHLYAGTRLPSGIGLNESIPNEEKFLNVSLKHINILHFHYTRTYKAK